MTLESVTIATRKSPLAIWQAEYVKEKLQEKYPHLRIDQLGLLTLADKMLETPLTKIGGKGLFVKELEQAILEKHADIAVHSIKDMPADLPEGLILAIVCKREDPRDVLVSNHYSDITSLPEEAVVGTSSLRRQAQLLALRPDLILKNLRGNVGTRLTKLDEGEFDAIILAAAGLKRLKMEERIKSYLSINDVLPAAGQGAIGIECHSGNQKVLDLISPLEDAQTRLCITAERAMTEVLGGNCQTPIAAYAQIHNDKIVLRGRVCQPDGKKILEVECEESVEYPQMLGQKAAAALLNQGAKDIIKNCG